MKRRMLLGLDLGSVSAKAVLLDQDHHLQGTWQERSRGDPVRALKTLLQSALGKLGPTEIQIAITGYGREMLSLSQKVSPANEIIVLALGAHHFSPDAISVIEIGGQASRWIHLQKEKSSDETVEIKDYAFNERCAAGSGAFIEQQAARLNLNIEDFSDLAARSKRGAAVAGRCSVFAKSDMIHLQQKGTPVDEIAYGLCLSMARNFVGNVLKGKSCVPPVLLAGGGSKNKGLLRAFREVLGLKKNLFTHPESGFVSAAGAALYAESQSESLCLSHWKEALSLFQVKSALETSNLAPLGDLKVKKRKEPSPSPKEAVKGFLGVDVGSISTNFSLVGLDGKVITGIYLPTLGRPIEALKAGLEGILDNCQGGLEILGIGTTGSGRYLAGKYLESDVITNEITAQMTGALHFFPDADTIFEIGGQDSKYIHIQNGRILDFTMNKICSAGTGSFLEEQAEHLKIDIERRFSRQASRSKSPFDLGCQCTVFMDTELVNAVNKGIPLPDITAGLAYAIARNYLEKVVMNRPVGDFVIFQGGVASNPSVVQAFSKLLKRSVHVHPYNRISGAIGAALLAQEKLKDGKRTSPDVDGLKKRVDQDYTIKSFQCRSCSNSCQVNRIRIEDEEIYFGDTCERYTSTQKQKRAESDHKSRKTLPDLFEERDSLIQTFINNPARPLYRIALPKASFMHEYLPFWATFFNDLGCEVALSSDSNMDTLEEGLKRLPAETCLPVKLAFGHVGKIDEKEADWIFLPSLLTLDRQGLNPLCPYGEHTPYMIKSSVDKRILSPSIDFEAPLNDFLVGLSSVRKALDLRTPAVKDAVIHAYKAQNEFSLSLRKRGQKILASLQQMGPYAWILLGKPYNLYDSFLNLNLNRHIQNLGVLGIPINYLPLDHEEPFIRSDLIAWKYNLQILQSAHWCLQKKGLYPIIISNFGCGPDAFMQKHLLDILKGKPYLFLEFDEHRAEAGLITRLEAFKDELDSIEKDKKKRHFSWTAHKTRDERPIERIKNKSFVLPYFSDHAYAFAGALKGVGFEADVLPPPDKHSLDLGEKQVSGKECHAFSILAGDLIKHSQSPREEEQVYFFPGSKVTCLLHQYEDGLNFILKDLGVTGLEVLAPPFDFLHGLIGTPGLTLLYRGLLAVDILIKAACEKRPYEVEKGLTDKIHKLNMRDIEKGLSAATASHVLQKCVDRLNSIEIKKEKRPIVGIAGDLYTRHNPIGNNNLFLKLEELGCEVWPAPFLVDSIDFGLRKSLHEAFRKKRLPDALTVGLMYLKKEMESRKIKKSLRGALSRLSEPSYKDIVHFASPYLGMENVDVLVLNIAKMVDFARRGADGVVNAICLNCMIGTISEALAARIRKDLDNIPIPTLIFGGTDLPSDQAKLEAFVYQVQQFADRKKKTLFVQDPYIN